MTTRNWGSSGLEVMQSLRMSVLGSKLVTNGTTQNLTATVGMSLLDPDPNAGAFVDNFLARSATDYANRPALFIEVHRKSIITLEFHGTFVVSTAPSRHSPLREW